MLRFTLAFVSALVAFGVLSARAQADDPPGPDAAAPAEEAPDAGADAADAADAADGVPTEKKRAAFDLLTLYQDNWFLAGFSEKHQIKFQFSVKFDLWPNEGHHAAYFAYSQRARWNLYDRSQPFAENNYSPEVFYTYWHRVPRYEPSPGCAFFRERAGVQHESNGESGAASRGWNRIYAATRYACYADDRERYVLGDLKVWAPPFGLGGDNPNIAKLYGYGELAFSAGRDGQGGWLDGVDLTVRARKGTRDWGTGSVELEAHWKPPYPGGWRFTPHLVAQLFHGQGETLLRYDEVVTAFRVGVGFSDRSTRSR